MLYKISKRMHIRKTVFGLLLVLLLGLLPTLASAQAQAVETNPIEPPDLPVEEQLSAAAVETYNASSWNVSGRVGIGTQTPGSLLDIYNPAPYGGHLLATGGALTLKAATPGFLPYIAWVQPDNVRALYMGWGNTAGTNKWLDMKLEHGYNLSIRGGNVGIGTTVPAANLHVNAPASLNPINAFRLDVQSFGTGANALASHFMQVGDVGNGNTYFDIRGDGNVGIGTTQPSARMSIVAPGSSELLGTAKSTTLLTSAGNLGTTAGNELALATIGFLSGGNNSSLGIRALRSASGSGWMSTAIGLGMDVDNTPRAGANLWLHANGNVGIGTSAPAANLHVNAPASLNPINAFLLDVQSFGTGANALASHFMQVRDIGNGNTYFDIRGDGSVGIGTANPAAKLDVAGTTRTQILQITGGSDLAEPFNVSGAATIQPGMVVAIDPEHPGQLHIADKAYDHMVAGVVSGAGGIQPGLVLEQQGTVAAGEHPVALTGRVFVWADATNGAIQPGDLLTTSDTPGHAMKVADHELAQGAILGKAMSSLDKGAGLVLMLVTLQ